MDSKPRCPKCNGYVKIEIVGQDEFIRCICGLCTPTQACTPPKKRNKNKGKPTFLDYLLDRIRVIYGYNNKFTTGELKETLSTEKIPPNLGTPLGILLARGLLDLIEEGKGKRGGSTWTLPKRHHN